MSSYSCVRASRETHLTALRRRVVNGGGGGDSVAEMLFLAVDAETGGGGGTVRAAGAETEGNAGQGRVGTSSR